MHTGNRSGVVVAHDYFTQRGGAERVALVLAKELQAERVITAFHRPEQTFSETRNVDLELLDSPMLKPFASDPRRALPLLSIAWSVQPPIDATAVVCSSSGWSHGIRVTERTRKIVYCHNPARWLYQRDDYVRGMSRGVRGALTAMGPSLRRWDRRAAHSADIYVANSTVVAQRIREAYGIDAHVVHPPISMDTAGPMEPVPGLEPGFFLTVARARSYKGTEVLKEAFARMPDLQLAVVGAPLKEPVPPNVTPLATVSDAQLRWLYANARALISISHEDFGLTPLEANAFGTPSLVLRSGGFLDSTAEGTSGLFIDDETIGSVIRATRTFPARWNANTIREHASLFSREHFTARMRELIGLPRLTSAAAHAA